MSTSGKSQTRKKPGVKETPKRKPSKKEDKPPGIDMALLRLALVVPGEP